MASEQRVAVVTGGTGAIGSAIVAALGATGHRTVALGRRDGDVVADLASESATRRAAAEVLDRYGRVDVLVHCAGVIDPMSLGEFDARRWRAVQAVNVEAALWLARAFTPGMAERGFGRIVLVASDTLWSPPDPRFLPYVASKGAMLGVVRTLAVDLGGDGIAVTAVAPGLTDTPIARSVNDAGQIEAVVATQAMKRPLTPEDTAHTVAFLASDGAQALTGQVLVVDGGATMR
ncbi:SDR family NAD(P)-dependent oxidoreductase [Saccharothrix coeruleofusca]|uniref:3-ketoacyl-ACP reductase n=1 Tax=Saccharothrix coeruleofusca TaxID=33919 RepID=A0A918EGA7_9PSEU|nr:SDR family oxidoreductase [Saccharothrix coeruleofusca]GGP67321.1 3-ketoacyl-ACP reductase [Saccharothrix coeruleofusca]